MKIKKDDNVIVIAGKDKGKTGKVVKSLPEDQKVVISGINVRKRHRKPRRGGEKGAVVDISLPIHVSNVMLIDPSTKKATRVGRKLVGDKTVRISKKTGAEI